MNRPQVRYAALALGLIVVLGAIVPAARAERFAFLVGVREYSKTELSNLQFSDNDIDELATTLQATGYAKDNMVVMSVPAGTTKGVRFLPLAKNIQQELKLLLESVGEEDTVLVALAGHGVQFKGEGGAYFCPMDAKLADRTTLIALDEIYQALEKSPARNKLLLVDACRNDPQTALGRSAKSIELEAVGRPQAVKLPKSISALYSCSEGQQAFEDPQLKHGVFFYYVIEGLRGAADVDQDKQVSIDELKLYAVKRVQSRVRIELGQSQTPQYVSHGAGELSLASLGPAVRPPEVPKPQPEPMKPAPTPMPSPAVKTDEITVIANYDDESVEGFRVGTPTRLWVTPLKGKYAGDFGDHITEQGRYLVVKGNKLLGFDVRTGKIVWEMDVATGGFSSFKIMSPRIFLETQDDRYEVNPLTGTLEKEPREKSLLEDADK